MSPPPAADVALDVEAGVGVEGRGGTAPTSELADELRLAVGRLARRIRQQTTFGLTPSQHSALVTIDRQAPVRLSDVAAAEGVAAPTVTKIVGGLEEAGLVRRETDPADKRSARVSTTPAGKAALRQIRTARTAFLRTTLEQLTDAERADLARALPVLVALSEALPR
jgi:DNA-binding MarR family transcriptional regulator